jgi:hypothetical protein
VTCIWGTGETAEGAGCGRRFFGGFGSGGGGVGGT